MIVEILGGIGLFLLGMLLMTDGLKALAGDALRRILTRHVSSARSGVAWGAALTALVQSSTATTLATVGFVSAGILTFTQAIGVVFGANLGTTSTGWIVSQLGFKVSLGDLAPPLVLLGAALRLLFKGRGAHAGTAVAGFALLFLGIDFLQDGMAAFTAELDTASLPGAGGNGSLGSRLVLVLVGCVATVITQSSSATMTATLAAVASGAIGLEQAAALVIGQNIGTTPTAVVASIGAPTAAKRTALVHVLFNVFTAGVALLVFPWLLEVCEWSAAALGTPDAPTVLAFFHTFFNALGVAVLLPLSGQLARLIERLVPERGTRATRHLGLAVARVGPVATEAARRAMIDVLVDVAKSAEDVLRGETPHGQRRAALDEASIARAEVVRFVHDLGRGEQGSSEGATQQVVLHASDHIERAIAALRAPEKGASLSEGDPGLTALAQRALELPRALLDACRDEAPERVPREAMRAAVARMLEASGGVAALRKEIRADALRLAAIGVLDPDDAMRRVDGALWIDSLAFHLARAAFDLGQEPAEVIAPTVVAPRIAPIAPSDEPPQPAR
ncbi:MAG: Na/Pi cotransporter family protein [Phycisphaera sp.]|nr:Na/Pi cotransporter family protein [Phycisphaera sp.]